MSAATTPPICDRCGKPVGPNHFWACFEMRLDTGAPAPGQRKGRQSKKPITYPLPPAPSDAS